MAESTPPPPEEAAVETRPSAAKGLIYWIGLLSLAYAVVRYHGFGGVPWTDFPMFILNKAISLTAFLLLTLNFALGPLHNLTGRVPASWLNARKALGMTGFLLAFVHLVDIYDLLDCIALSGPDVDAYLGEGGELNTEDKPIIEFRAPRNMNRIVTEYLNLEEIMRHRTFPETVLAGGWGDDPGLAAERRATLERYFTGTTGVLMAHQAHLVGQFAREEALLREVLKVNPDDRDAPFLLERLERIRRGGQDPEW